MISPFARDRLTAILETLDRNADLLAATVFQEGLESVVPASIPEDLQNAITALTAALEAESPTVAEQAMAQRRAAWAEAEGNWNEARKRYETALDAFRLGFIKEAQLTDENFRFGLARKAYDEAEADALKAGFIPA